MNKIIKKEKQIKLRNKKLLKEFSFMSPVDWCGNKVSSRIHRFRCTAWDDIPAGWRKAFGELLAKEIKTALINDGIPPGAIWFVQIKEKFGELRMYSNLYTRSLNRLLSDYEVISRHVCMACGKPDSGITVSGWTMPLCEECAKKLNLDISPPERIPDSYDVVIWSSADGKTTSTIYIKDKADMIRNNYDKRKGKHGENRQT